MAYCFESSILVYTFAICSLVIGSFITVKQTEIKRFIAYSSIAQVGFILIGDLPAAYIYILTYICSSLLFFSIILSESLNNQEIIYLSDLRIIKKNSL
jgi:NADH-quinone oxidoreductase subunit N